MLAVTAAGLRAHGSFSRAPNSAAPAASGAALAIVLSAAEGLAFVAFVIVLVSARPQRKPARDEEPPRPPLPWWVKTLGVLLAVAALITPFAVLLTRKARSAPARPLTGVPGGGPGRLTAPHPGAGSVWPVIVGMGIAIAVVLVLTVLSRRRRPAATPRDKTRRAHQGLLDSLAAGRDALTAGGEPREAIIACYVAMERGFAAAGSAPAAADTPAEVLTRATAAGIVRSGSAELLTGLFRRARYSSQPMTSADSDAAVIALDQMLTESASA